MPTTIHKYVLQIQARQVLSMPSGAKALHAAMQDGELTVWMQVSTKPGPDALLPFYVYGLGQTIPDNDAQSMAYIGTTQDTDARYIWHVFIGKEEPQ